MKAPRESGMALPLALWFMALALTLIGLYVFQARTEQMQANAWRRQVQATALTRASVTYALARLQAPDPAMRWAADGSPKQWTFAGAQLDVTIRAEAGKWDLNAGALPVFQAWMQGQHWSPELQADLLQRIQARRQAFTSTTGTAEFRSVLELEESPLLSTDAGAGLQDVATVTTHQLLPDTRFAGTAMRVAMGATGNFDRATVWSGQPVTIRVTGSLPDGFKWTDVTTVTATWP